MNKDDESPVWKWGRKTGRRREKSHNEFIPLLSHNQLLMNRQIQVIYQTAFKGGLGSNKETFLEN